MSDEPEAEAGLYLALVSIHGLIRGHDLELGRDPDTGGQVLYVVELARALARLPEVARVDLFTRKVIDPAIHKDYAQPIEKLAEGASIVRIDCGAEEYIRKEELWDHLDTFADNLLAYLGDLGLRPDALHTHYADAGYVGQRVALQMGLPLIHTGHSLGRVKRRRLLALGMNGATIEERYAMSRRIDAEEDTLAAAQMVVVSTENEIKEQYELYDHYRPEQMCVVPPGTNLDRFHPPRGGEDESRISLELNRFLTRPDKPLILAISRPDERKNIKTLIEAYGESPELQELANLVIVAGTRDDIREMDDSAARVLIDILLHIDTYDLYGKVAYPKHHSSEDVPLFFRLAALRRGGLINPALTEPFGLTLIEAAASGLPIVATEDGGPREIIANCNNGTLINPLDAKAMAGALLDLLLDAPGWEEKAAAGLRGVQRHYAWPAHAVKYLRYLRPIIERAEPRAEPPIQRRTLLYHNRALFTDLDQNLLGDQESLQRFVQVMRENRKCSTFGIATGRNLRSALREMRRAGISPPDVLITSAGTQINYAPNMTSDSAWTRHIDHLWTPRAVRNILGQLPGLKLQPLSELSRFKLSYFYDPDIAPSPEEITRLLRHADQTVNMVVSFGQFIDIVPVRASKGFALRWFAQQWDIPLERILAAGGSGNDEDMMRGNTLAVVVANRHDEELSQLTDIDRIYFAQKSHAAGILEAIEHYDFYGECRVPE